MTDSNLRYCVGCRERWVPGALQCPSCGFVAMEPITFGKPPAQEVFGSFWLWLSSLIGGMMGIPVALAHQGNIFLGDMVSHGGYRLHYREHDQFVVGASFVASLSFVGLAFVVAIIRMAKREPKAIWQFILTACLLFFAALFAFVSKGLGFW